MSENTNDRNGNNDQGNKDKAAREEFCALCHRSSSVAGKMIHMPNGMPVCADCMQKTMNMTANMDFSSLLGMTPDQIQHMLGVTPDQLQNMLRNIPAFPMFSGNPGAGNPFMPDDGAPADAGKNDNAADGSSDQNRNVDAAKGTYPVRTVNGGSNDGGNDGSGNGGNDGKDSGDGKKGGPNVTFFNLGDLFGGGGLGGRPQVKKRTDKNRPKPEFSIDHLPAPHVIKSKLDEYVIGQDQAKKILSVAVYNHYKRVKTGHMDDIDIEKSNILMIGPTGSGKTYLVRTLARLLDVPLAIADATSLTEAGYIGDDIESVISKLLDAADGDVERTERGIVFIDEIDKIAKKSTQTSRDVNGESVQQGMLKLLEGAEVEVPVGASSKNAMVPMQMINTRNILFICGGAFPNLDEIIKLRLTEQSGFGFSAELKDKYDNDPELLSKVTTEDLRKFGFIPEFIGRLPIICTLKGLTEDSLKEILTKPKNAILSQYQKLLALDGVDLEFTDNALTAIADKAIEKETGARALRSIIEGFMLDIMYEVPKDPGIGRVTVTGDYVNGKGLPVIESREVLPAEELRHLRRVQRELNAPAGKTNDGEGTDGADDVVVPD